MPRVIRQPSHAGSWYSDNVTELADSIDSWLAGVQDTAGPGARAVIGPHAGYRYCGHVFAHAYRYINPASVSRVFLLGPSHHFYSRSCLLSTASVYKTPLGDLQIDEEIYKELLASGKFELVDLEADEAEHSLELHTPYIARLMRGRDFTLVPIVVGALTTESEAVYGKVLGPYLDDPSNVFIISSDFCHWGKRFSYTEYNQSQGPIWKSIEWLDHLGMQAIETGQPQPFADYLKQYKNTICGRHPIGVLLNMLQHCKTQHKVEFKHYDQSSKCEGPQDSSVSYAAAVVSAV